MVCEKQKSCAWPGKELLFTFFFFVVNIVTWLRHSCRHRRLILDITVFFIFFGVWWWSIQTYVGLCAYEGGGHRRMLGVLISQSVSYYFETGPLNEPGAKLAVIKFYYFFCLHSHIVLGLQAFTTMPFYKGAWDLNSVTYACATWNCSHWTVSSGPWSWILPLPLPLQAVPISSVVSLLPTTQYGAGYPEQSLLFAGNKGINKIISALYMLTVKKEESHEHLPMSAQLEGVGVLGWGTSLGVCQTLAVFLNLEGE